MESILFKEQEELFRYGGTLILGDNFEALQQLREDPEVKGKVILVYIDPPFGTKQIFTVTDDRFASISRVNGGRIAYSDSLSGKEYLKFIGERLELIKSIMAENGSIYFHIDCKMGHYIKILMDDIFGQENFINDISRIKCNPKNFSRKGYGNMKDIVLFYTKTKRYVWNEPRQKIDFKDNDLRFRSVDSDGRYYTTTPLHAPGETTNGATGKKWREMLPPPGRHWRYPPDMLDELDKKGLIEWSTTGNPRKKIYKEDVIKAGVKVQDVWMYKDPQNPIYPTEKNINMLKMIISASSNTGDIILDAFCGAGTTLVAAQQLGRKWVGIDSSKEAINICSQRLEKVKTINISQEVINE